jgi:curved DNA-binding protein CbpA
MNTPPITPPKGIFICPPVLPSQTPSTFVDHYAVLNLDCYATSEEIKAAHRKLRAEYFCTDAQKYAALQAAYAVLVNWEARREYDVMYRKEFGVPAPPEAKVGGKVEAMVAKVEQATIAEVNLEKEKRPTLAISIPAVPTSEEEEDVHVSPRDPPSPTPSSPFDELANEREDSLVAQLQLCEEESRDQDPNWALKHSKPRSEAVLDTRPYPSLLPIVRKLKHSKPRFQAVLGTRPYPSLVPIARAYNGRKTHKKLGCARPRYVGGIAGNARPA